jgi:hypothetical protein
LAEEAAVFAVELAGTFVSDLKGRTGGVQTVHEHASPRCMQPKLLLIPRPHGEHGQGLAAAGASNHPQGRFQTRSTKGRYKFPFGDFKKVHRCAVLSAESRAGQYKHYDIEQAAAHLHEMIDGKKHKARCA